MSIGKKHALEALIKYIENIYSDVEKANNSLQEIKRECDAKSEEIGRIIESLSPETIDTSLSASGNRLSALLKRFGGFHSLIQRIARAHSFVQDELKKIVENAEHTVSHSSREHIWQVLGGHTGHDIIEEDIRAILADDNHKALILFPNYRPDRIGHGQQC